MKVIVFPILMCFGILMAWGQNTIPAEERSSIQKTREMADRNSSPTRPFSHINHQETKKPPLPFLHYESGKQIPKPVLAKNRPGTIGPGDNNIARRSLGDLCKDTSYSRLLSVYNGEVYVESITQTMDGGILVSATMYDTMRLPNPWWRSYGLLIKLDGEGSILWLKQFEALNPGDISNFYIKSAFELSTRDIICTGSWDSGGNSSSYKTIVYRLTENGNIIWQNNLETTIGNSNDPPIGYSFWVQSATMGLNGDVILCGTSYAAFSDSKTETAVRLNASGQLVWDANFANSGNYSFGAEGISAFIKNGQVVLVGLSHGSNNPQTPPAVNFFTLDYTNGNLLTRRFFRPDYADNREEFSKSFTYWDNKCTRLQNGNLVFYGKLFSDFGNMSSPGLYFGVIEFDASFNLVNSYTIGSDVKSNFYNNILHFDSTGRGLISILEYISSYEANLFFGSFNNRQFHNQRKAHYAGVGLPGRNGFSFLKDNGYAYLQSYFQVEPSRSFLEFRKMHNSDTSS